MTHSVWEVKECRAWLGNGLSWEASCLQSSFLGTHCGSFFLSSLNTPPIYIHTGTKRKMKWTRHNPCSHAASVSPATVYNYCKSCQYPDRGTKKGCESPEWKPTNSVHLIAKISVTFSVSSQTIQCCFFFFLKSISYFCWKTGAIRKSTCLNLFTNQK